MDKIVLAMSNLATATKVHHSCCETIVRIVWQPTFPYVSQFLLFHSDFSYIPILNQFRFCLFGNQLITEFRSSLWKQFLGSLHQANTFL